MEHEEELREERERPGDRDDALLEEQRGKGYGSDPGEREEALDEELDEEA